MSRPFKFCPSCGSALGQRASDGGARCPSCGRTWYRNPAPTVGVALVRDGRALVTQRARDPNKGQYDVPGGFLKLDEDALQGLRRELKEELGIEIDVRDEDCVQLATHTYGDEDFHVIAIGFVGRLVSGEPEPADDVSGFSWVAESDLDEVDFAWPHDRELVRRALKRGDG